ncbi:MAG TPA: pirin family protein [Polyangiaceae bacterium]|nr:pirin family protein [Polyangiaceae bacterium]
MITVRKAADRGRSQHGWLDSRHTFSFADYYDPAHVAFSKLRVINDDRVAPGRGFGTHGHRDMEILSYVIEGAIEHKDSLGTGSIIRPGDVQRMTAGTGVRHSEFNPSATDPVRFLQIWILPQAEGLTPGYEQRTFPLAEKRGRWRLVAAPDGRDGSVILHQDVLLFAGCFERGEEASLSLAAGRKAWVQVARGAISVNGTRLEEGDGAAVEGERQLGFADGASAELLAFDLP